MRRTSVISSLGCQIGLLRRRLVPLKDSRNVRGPFALPAGGPVLTSCVLAAVIGAQRPLHRQSRTEPPPSSSLRSFCPWLIPSLTPPIPHAGAKGASLFVPDSSRANLSRPRTMHDEIRTGPPYGHALSIRHNREAQIETTLSFQNLEAALPPGIPAGEPIQ